MCTYINDNGAFLLEVLHDGGLGLADGSRADEQIGGVTGGEARLRHKLTNEAGGTGNEDSVLLGNDGDDVRGHSHVDNRDMKKEEGIS